MQASNVFLEANSAWIRYCIAVSPAGRSVSGAALTEAAIEAFIDCNERQKKLLFEDALKMVCSISMLEGK